jgi:hypothetical protein
MLVPVSTIAKRIIISSLHKVHQHCKTRTLERVRHEWTNCSAGSILPHLGHFYLAHPRITSLNSQWTATWLADWNAMNTDKTQKPGKTLKRLLQRISFQFTQFVSRDKWISYDIETYPNPFQFWLQLGSQTQCVGFLAWTIFWIYFGHKAALPWKPPTRYSNPIHCDQMKGECFHVFATFHNLYSNPWPLAVKV